MSIIETPADRDRSRTKVPPSLGADARTAQTVRSERVNGSAVDCLLVASSGGHLLQLVQLRDEWERDGRHWVTFDKPDARSLLDGEEVTWAYSPTNRSLRNLVRNAFLAVRLLRRLRPAAIVTTGAGVAVPFCWLGRLFGARVVYIESFSRLFEPSLTGRLVHPVAHDFFVQWPQMRQHFRKARYEGQIF
jgi:beta-1,4-N-acetylglucosaminyltransferase